MQSRQASRSRHSFSSVIILQSIADAGLSQYMSWLLHRLRASCEAGEYGCADTGYRPPHQSPNLLQQLAMHRNYSGMEGKLLKYIVFLGKKPDLATARRNDAPYVDGSTPPEVKHVAVRASLAPEGSGSRKGAETVRRSP